MATFDGTLDPGETVLWRAENVTLAIPDESEDGDGHVHDKGQGVLAVTSSRITWTRSISSSEVVSSSADSPPITSFEVPASQLSMHAISREGVEPGFQRPCIYCQLDESRGGPSQVYFAPLADLEGCFRAMSQVSTVL